MGNYLPRSASLIAGKCSQEVRGHQETFARKSELGVEACPSPCRRTRRLERTAAAQSKMQRRACGLDRVSCANIHHRLHRLTTARTHVAHGICAPIQNG